MALKTYTVKEMFGPTIQGEGKHSGSVVLFLRFAGCNRWSGREEDREKSVCSFCDTDFVGGGKLTGEEIVGRLLSMSPVRKLVVTGGEPTLQFDRALAKALRDAGFEIRLETNGSKSIDYLDLVYVAMSPKQTREETKIAFVDEVKILWPPILDGVTPEEFENFPGATQRFLQPVLEGSKNNIKKTIEKLYDINGSWQLSLQTHKIIGVQ